MFVLAFLATQTFTVLDQGLISSAARKETKAVFERIDDEKTLQDLFADLKKTSPKVEFSESMVVHLSLSRLADRMTLKIESVVENDQGLTLTYSITPSAIEGGPTQRIPYAVLKLKKSDASLRIVQQTKGPGGKIETEKVVATIPRPK